MTTTESIGALEVAQNAGVRELTLCRPDVLNRFDDVLHDELTRALNAAAADSETLVVLLRSTGRVFSAGGDFELMRRCHEDGAYRHATIDRARELMAALLELPQPLVAAVQGAAMGLGATIVLAADAVVASRNVKLADTHVNVGLVPGDGGCLVWPAALGMPLARRHLLTGEPLDATAAHRLGVVTDLVESPDDVLPAARAIAAQIAALPPLAVQGTRRVLNALARRRFDEVFELAASLESETLASTDLLEAIAAFREKRPGRFRGL